MPMSLTPIGIDVSNGSSAGLNACDPARLPDEAWLKMKEGFDLHVDRRAEKVSARFGLIIPLI